MSGGEQRVGDLGMAIGPGELEHRRFITAQAQDVIAVPLTALTALTASASAPVSGALVCLFALERVAGYRPPESEPLSAT